MPDPPQDPAESSSGNDAPYFKNKTLSRRASKILVVVSIVVILAVSIGGALLLINMAQTAEEEGIVPPDTLEEAAPDPRSNLNGM